MSLAPDLVAAIHQGNCNDPFAWLGLHGSPDGTGLIARGYFPGAESVALAPTSAGASATPMQRYPDSDLFEARLAGGSTAGHHSFLVQYPGHGETVLDPYGFASLLRDDDVYLFNEGTSERVYQWMGAVPATVDGIAGTHFCLWAPNAQRVAVVGDFNHWDGRKHGMRHHPASGLWDIFMPEVAEQALYKFQIVQSTGARVLKADPLAIGMQPAPDNACVVRSDGGRHHWGDQAWLQQRAKGNAWRQPMSTYEVHLGSWRRRGEEGNRYLSYREIGDELIPYAKDLGFTHLQFMPVSEFPFDGSWGYQPVGLFAPTSRFGSAEDFQELVDRCHQAGLGVLLDWVPGHFPGDDYGLLRFDGTALYEHADPRKGFHPDWNTYIYNYGRAEVRSILTSNALYWLDRFHIDGLRVDAVASMLYLDYSREAGEWIPNEQGGRENLEAMALLRQVNERLHANHPGATTVAEESTAWPGVSRPVDQGGLGFGFKWNMGWMNDTLAYMARDPIHRSHHHDEISFGLVYAFDENFVLPLSHDEVVHGKGSLIGRMPGDHWQRFANLRAYYGFMWTHPGKKLLFMGGEFAQEQEWNHDAGLDWHLLGQPAHAGVQHLVRDLNLLYRNTPALHELDCEAAGFEWIDHSNASQGVYSWIRHDGARQAPVVVVVNMTPSTHRNFTLGVPRAGTWRELLNTDAAVYGGSNVGNLGVITAHASPSHGQPCQLSLSVPPLATLVLQWTRN